ncbi:MAG: hypothetical protein ACI85K_002018 [Hyphomicrobiaceae bacterium]|jgi:hypothetical protein
MRTMTEHQPRIVPILLVAAILTLAVTIVRVIGECNQWDSFWFSPEPGSPLNPFGIVWLVPVFGFLFGRRLSQSGGAPRFVTGFFVPMFGFFAIMGAAFAIGAQFEGQEMLRALTYFLYGAPVLSLLALFAWPRAFVALLAYGIVARVPVMLVQYLDVQNGWQTHYGRLHPKLGVLAADDRIWLLTLAQAGLWIPFTITLGCAFAAIGAATAGKR